MAVREFLEVKNVFYVRMQTGAIILGEGTANRRFYRSGRPGMADILALPRVMHLAASMSQTYSHALPVWIECKSGTGRQSQVQKDFQREVENQGHIYLLVRDVQQVIDALKESI